MKPMHDHCELRAMPSDICIAERLHWVFSTAAQSHCTDLSFVVIVCPNCDVDHADWYAWRIVTFSPRRRQHVQAAQ